MKFKILKNDLKRNKIISIILLLFIVFSSLLVSGAVSIVSGLQGSVDNLFEKADALHFLQMHSGEIAQSEIDEFSINNPLVKNQQSIEMINIEGDYIFLTEDKISLTGSSIDMGFVTQSKEFDYLLDLDNNVFAVKDGQVAVPIHYMTTYDLSIGDNIYIQDGTYNKTFEISNFLRDSQMNSTLASSKRFVVSETDHAELLHNTGSIEYLIEFQLTDVSHVSEFTAQYIAAGLPSQGPTIEYPVLRMINMITDGVVAAVIILAGFMLVSIALLCVRFTILATLEEDMVETGVMKAIGISHTDIRELYTIKYLIFALIGCVTGYFLSMIFSHLFTQNIALYMGAPETTIWTILLPLISVSLVFFIILIYCRKLVNSIRMISAVEAMYPERIINLKKRKAYLSIKKLHKLNRNICIALHDLFSRFKTYASLIILFIICVVLVIIPFNLLNTLQSSSFIEYMGVSKTDIRIDLQQNDDILGIFSSITSELETDSKVDKWVAFKTYKSTLQTDDGLLYSLDVESGDFSVFPIEYLSGTGPIEEGDIALSYLWAQELKYDVDDIIELTLPNNTTEQMTISGIYQDITNGGKTAKAILPEINSDPIRCLINININDSIDLTSFQQEYKDAFPAAKVTDIEDYLNQTYGGLVSQTRLVVILASAISSIMLLLIVSLFLKLMLAKDTSQNVIMMSLGFSRKDIRIQYFIKILALLFIGILLAVIFSNTLGQSLVGMIFKDMGLPKLEFAIKPLQIFIAIPALLYLVSGFAAWLGTQSIKNISISTLNAE